MSVARALPILARVVGGRAYPAIEVETARMVSFVASAGANHDGDEDRVASVPFTVDLPASFPSWSELVIACGARDACELRSVLRKTEHGFCAGAGSGPRMGL